MNNKIKIILAALFIVSIHSCQDFLEEPIRGAQDLESYFQTDLECEKFLAGCYQSILQGDQYWYINWYYILTASATDDAWLSMPSEVQTDETEFSIINVSSQNTWLYPFWEYMYNAIYQCNLALAKLPESPVYDNNPELIERLIGEAKFIRAYAHFELAKNWEQLPIMDHVHSPEELLEVELSDQQTVYDFIISDLQDAILVLPVSYDEANTGRATKGAAWSYLAKAYMYNEQWENAYEYANTVIETGPYTLEPVFGEIWDVNNRNGMESIFEFQTNYEPNYETGNSFPILTGGQEDEGWYYGTPTSHLENEYLALDDTIRLRATIIKAFNEDLVKDTDIGYAKVYDTDGVTVVVDSLPVAKLEDSKSMRINRKFFILPEDRIENYGNQFRRNIPKNHILMRLAEVKLIRAEAMWHMVQAGGAAFSESDIIAGDLHDIRSRAMLPDIASSGDLLLLDIYKERRLELAMEFKRWDEIRRAKHPADGRRMIYHIMGPQGSFVLYNTVTSTDYWENFEISSERESSDKGIEFEAGAEWMPIPARDQSWLNL